MEFIIDEKQSIAEIQELFQDRFPFLKISFFSTPHQTGEGTPAEHMYNSMLTLEEIGTLKHEGKVTISGTMSVGDVEKMFIQKYGIPAQIFRRSGTSWIQTTTTDSWTLNNQNDKGREMSTPFAEDKDMPDYQEQS
jgi:hypothetical protein